MTPSVAVTELLEPNLHSSESNKLAEVSKIKLYMLKDFRPKSKDFKEGLHLLCQTKKGKKFALKKSTFVSNQEDLESIKNC